MFCGQNYRNGHKTALGEDNIRPEFLQDPQGFAISFHNTEGIGKVFNIKIAAQFSGRNSAVGYSDILDKFFFDSLVGTNITDFVSKFQQGRNQGQIWCDMAGSSTTG